MRYDLKAVPRRPMYMTWAGLWAERVTRAFWPLWSVVFVCLSALMLGLHDVLRLEVVWTLAVLGAVSCLASAAWGIWRFRRPTRQDVASRLDRSMPGRPLQTLADRQAIGGNDPASGAVWAVHQQRMADRAAHAKFVQPDLRVARRDPYALRYLGVLALAVAVLFGSVLRVGSVAQIAPGSGPAGTVAGPAWEGWVEPPRYTGLPVLYLADQAGGTIQAPEGSVVTLRLYGEVGALTIAETVSGRTENVPSAAEPAQEFSAVQSGRIEISGPGGRAWEVEIIADQPPTVAAVGEAEIGAQGEMTLPFEAMDDYGIAKGSARITLDMAALDRRFGQSVEPEPRAAIELGLPLPLAGKRDDFEEVLIEDFSKHPWSGLPVRIELGVTDEAGQAGVSEAWTQDLPGRRFFEPLAAAVAEQRRDLLWSRENAPRVAQMLRAISYRPEDVFRDETAYLRLRFILRRLETFTRYGLTVEQRDELAEALWDLAVLLDEGDLADALERLRRAQERLSEAMKDGASDDEIAELMQELREATEDYLRQLSRQAQNDPNQQQQQGQQGQQEMMQMTQDDLQRMMDRIQELMEQGRMAEAQEALDQLQQMMENMRVTQGQQGQGQQSEGQQAMEGLSDTLRDQQGLSDEAFRDLQEQFNPNAQLGNRQGNAGRDGDQGRGQTHNQGDGQGSGDGENRAEGDPNTQGSLAERQEALRRELERQRRNLPSQGSEAGRRAGEALEGADRAMRDAEDALRDDDLAGAIDRQAEAMEQLREGMRNLGEALAEEQRNQGQQGQAPNERAEQGTDPLGRNPGSNGQLGTDEELTQGEDVYRRAQELLDEIRRRSGDGARPELELDYLERLLERF